MDFRTGFVLLVVASVGCVMTDLSDVAPGSSSDPTSAPTVHTSTVHQHTSTAQKHTTEHTSHTTHNTQTTAAHTSMAPTTQKPSSDGVWTARYHDNGPICILLKANISIDFKYKSTTTNQTVTNKVNVPLQPNSTSTGTCGKEEQSIEIDFFSNWKLILNFQKTNDSKHYMSSVHLDWFLEDVLSDAPNISGHNGHSDAKFNTSKTGYYCMARVPLYENASVVDGLLTIYTEHLQVESFQMKNDTKFSNSYDRCSEDTISNLVPIIVGACLGGLIIVVLVAYLIGRKRSRRGYESV